MDQDEFYLEADENGFYARDEVALHSKFVIDTVAEGVAVIEEHIQEQIDNYNLTNGVLFADVHACANYKDTAGYIHKEFCADIWDFNVATWEAGRTLQAGIIDAIPPAPTKAEFKALLPVWGA